MTVRKTKPYRVLTLDGGGARGLYTVSLLQELARRFGPPVADFGRRFDLIAGTSTGSIIAAALALGVSLDATRNFYAERGPIIFSNPIPPSRLSMMRWAWKHRNRSSANRDELAAALTEVLGASTLEDLWKARGIALCIPCTKMSSFGPTILKTPHNTKLFRDGPVRLVDACLASSAAPMILPLATIPNPADPTHSTSYADGGLWANSPVLVGILEALALAGPDQPIEVLSVGTASSNAGSAGANSKLDRGLSDWKFGIGALEASLEAQSVGQANMANLIIPHLRQNVTVLRLDKKSASPEQASHLGLDRAGQLATETLMSLAHDDADTISSEDSRRPLGELRIADFFVD